MNVIFLIADVGFLVYSIGFSYFWWFKSKEYVAMNVKRRREYRKKLFFMPQVLMFDFYDQNPRFEAWINRLVGLIFVVFGGIGAFVSINGPFQR